MDNVYTQWLSLLSGYMSPYPPCLYVHYCTIITLYSANVEEKLKLKEENEALRNKVQELTEAWKVSIPTWPYMCTYIHNI